MRKEKNLFVVADWKDKTNVENRLTLIKEKKSFIISTTIIPTMPASESIRG